MGSIPNADHCAEIKKETKKLDVWHEPKVEKKSSLTLVVHCSGLLTVFETSSGNFERITYKPLKKF